MWVEEYWHYFIISYLLTIIMVKMLVNFHITRIMEISCIDRGKHVRDARVKHMLENS